jgi:hypothetical protein
VQLGVPPQDANTVHVELTCLTAGRFKLVGGTTICDARDAARGKRDGRWTSSMRVPINADRTVKVWTSERARWRVTAEYRSVIVVPWGVNARGQSYGVASQQGMPDLLAVTADNGRSGYMYAMNPSREPEPTSPAQAGAMQRENDRNPKPFLVYASDGVTLVGEIAQEPLQGRVIDSYGSSSRR